MKKVLASIVLAFLPILVAMPTAQAANPSPDEIFAGYELVDDWQVEEAAAFTQDLLEKYPDSGDAHFLHARVEFFRGNYDYSWDILKRVSDNRMEVKDFKTRVNNTRQAASKFISRESDHFILRYIEGPDEILLNFAENVLERSYETVGQLLGYRPQEKVLVEFYPDRGSLALVSPLTRRDILTSGTVALCKYNRLMMITPASLVRGYNWMDTLSHEYIHYILTRKSRNRFPLWLHEGVAKHFEARWREGGTALAPLLESVLAGGLANDYLIALDSMMPSFAKLKTAEDVQLAYAEVSTMVAYMVALKGESVISDLLSDLAAEQPFESALEARLGTSLETFQDGWKQFMKTQNLKEIPGLKAQKTRFKENHEGGADEKTEYRELDSRRARDLTFLGDILKSRNQLQAAILEYEKAVKESKTQSPILSNKLGAAYLFNKEFETAEIVLKKNLQFFPMFHTTLTNLGELYRETGRFEQSRDYFEKALAINPFNPFVHLRLIEVYDRFGLQEEKEQQEELYKLIN